MRKRLVIVFLVIAGVSLAVNALIMLCFGPVVGLVAALPGGWRIGSGGMRLALNTGFLEP